MVLAANNRQDDVGNNFTAWFVAVFTKDVVSFLGVVINRNLNDKDVA